jgi:hypothetical protein
MTIRHRYKVENKNQAAMKTNNPRAISMNLLFILIAFVTFPVTTKAQSYAAWYNSAQERIDTLRKGNYGIQIIAKNGEPFTGDISVRMKKHEYPFGIAFDFYEGNAGMGNSFSTTEAIIAEADSVIYQTERWNDYLAYAIPV